MYIYEYVISAYARTYSSLVYALEDLAYPKIYINYIHFDAISSLARTCLALNSTCDDELPSLKCDVPGAAVFLNI